MADEDPWEDWAVTVTGEEVVERAGGVSPAQDLSERELAPRGWKPGHGEEYRKKTRRCCQRVEQK